MKNLGEWALAHWGVHPNWEAVGMGVLTFVRREEVVQHHITIPLDVDAG